MKLAYSTCPNDTFIFEAIANKKIDLEGIDFSISMDDIDVLNKNAASIDGPDITKISANAYGDGLWKTYSILDAGSALGRNNGPLLVAKKDFPIEEINSKSILIPGEKTTANLLFSTFFPNAKNKTVSLFSQIESKILDGSFDCGLLIHEGRFTYKQKGLVKILDLGEKWEQETQMPIPLGMIVGKRSLGNNVLRKVSKIIHRSIQHAFENSESAMPYIRAFAKEMDEAVMKNHIQLYVNDFTLSLGEQGRSAIRYMLKNLPDDIFVE